MSMLDDQGGSSRDVWDSEANSYENIRWADPVYSSSIYQTVNGVPRGLMRCLDAGSGTGLSTTVLSSRCKSIVAVDYSHASLRVLQSKCLKNVHVVQADLRHLPFRDSSFDASLCANTLQHLKPNGPQQSAVAELRRVTRGNGLLTISVHHYSYGKQRAGWLKEGKPGQVGIDYIYRFTCEDVKALLPDAWIAGVGFYGISKCPFIGGRLQNVWARLFGRIAAVLGAGHMLIARVIVTKSIKATTRPHGIKRHEDSSALQ